MLRKSPGLLYLLAMFGVEFRNAEFIKNILCRHAFSFMALILFFCRTKLGHVALSAMLLRAHRLSRKLANHRYPVLPSYCLNCRYIPLCIYPGTPSVHLFLCYTISSAINS
jgi:hypothetical protein